MAIEIEMSLYARNTKACHKTDKKRSLRRCEWWTVRGAVKFSANHHESDCWQVVEEVHHATALLRRAGEITTVYTVLVYLGCSSFRGRFA